MDESEHAKFKAFQAEHGAESAYLVYPDRTDLAFVRVFKEKGGLVRLDFQIAENDRKGPATHVQVVVGRDELSRLLADPLDPDPAYGPDA